jgi:hypothetical protein
MPVYTSSIQRKEPANAVFICSIVGDGQASHLDWIFSLYMPVGEHKLVL